MKATVDQGSRDSKKDNNDEYLVVGVVYPEFGDGHLITIFSK